MLYYPCILDILQISCGVQAIEVLHLFNIKREVGDGLIIQFTSGMTIFNLYGILFIKTIKSQKRNKPRKIDWNTQ